MLNFSMDANDVEYDNMDGSSEVTPVYTALTKKAKKGLQTWTKVLCQWTKIWRELKP